MSRPLPTELIVAVANELAATASLATLAAFARCSRGVNEALTPILYRKLVLTRNKSDAIFAGLPRKVRGYKSRGLTWRQYRARIAKFTNRYERYLDSDYECGSDFVHDFGLWDEWAETDDEETYDEEAIVAASSAANLSWKRRLELLAHCKTLIIVEVPRLALVRDLFKATNVRVTAERGAYDSEDDYAYGSPSDYPDKDEDEDNVEEDNDEDEDNGQVFPNLARLSIHRRAARYAIDYDALFGGDDGPDRKYMQRRPGRYFPFHRLVECAFGRPSEVCIQMPRQLTAPEYLYLMMRGVINSPYRVVEAWYLYQYLQSYMDRDSLSMWPRGERRTLHGLHCSQLPRSSHGKLKTRVFFDDHSSPLETGESRAHSILKSLEGGETVLELVGVGRGVGEVVETEVELADPDEVHGMSDLVFSDEEEDKQEDDENRARREMAASQASDEATSGASDHPSTPDPGSASNLATEETNAALARDAGIAIRTAVEDDLLSNPARYTAFHRYPIPEDDPADGDPAADQVVRDLEEKLEPQLAALRALGPERRRVSEIIYHVSQSRARAAWCKVKGTPAEAAAQQRMDEIEAHWEWEVRRREIGDISVDQHALRQAKYKAEAIRAERQSVRRQERVMQMDSPIMSTVKFLEVDEVEPCICCGLKTIPRAKLAADVDAAWKSQT